MPRYMNYRLFCIIFCFYTITSFAQNELENTKEKNSIVQDTSIARQLLDSVEVKLNMKQLSGIIQLIDSSSIIYDRTLGKENAGFARLLYLKGKYLFGEGQIDSAIQSTKAAIDIQTKLFGETQKILGDFYYQLRMYFIQKGEYDESIFSTEKALTIWINVLGEDHENIAAAYYNLGIIYEDNKREYEKAIYYYVKALDIWEKIFGNHHPYIASAYKNMSLVYSDLNEYDKAVFYAKKSLEINIKNNGEEHPKVADDCGNIGYFLAIKDNYDDALTYVERAYQIKLKVFGENHPELIIALLNVGAIYLAKIDDVNALFYFEKGLRILELHNMKDHPFLPTYYLNIGGIYAEKGDYEWALQYYSKGLSILNNESLVTAQLYGNVGNVYEDMDENNIALTYYEKALNIFLKNLERNAIDIASTYNNIGVVYKKIGDNNRAISFHEKAVEILSKFFTEDHSDIARNYDNIGSTYLKDKIYEKALSYREKALKIRLKVWGKTHSDVVKSYNHIGDFYKEINDYEKALDRYDNALIANGFQTKKFEDVLNLDELINTFQQLGYTYLSQYQKHSNIASLHQAQQYFLKGSEAIDYLRSTFIEGSSKQTLTQKNYAVYEGMLKTDYLLSQESDSLQYIQEAFQFASRAKSQLLYEALQEADALRFAGLPDSLLEQEYNLRIDITYNEKRRQERLNDKVSETDSTILAISSKLFDLKQDYEKLKNNFINNYPDYYNLKYNQETISAEGVQRDLLSPNQALLEYFVGDSSIFVFVLRPDTLLMQEVKKDFPLEAWVKSLRDNIYQNRTTGATAYAEAAYNLYQKLILPIKSLLPEQVIIIPDGILGYVPFEALLTAKPERAIRFNSHAYLLKDHQISYSYSATLLREMQQKQRVKEPSETLLAVAPFYSGDTTLLANLFAYDETTRKDLSPLQNSGEEVYRISKLWKGEVLTGADATETKFTELAGNYRILHLATHGRADERVGDYSFLAFSEIKDNIENELLYVRDLYNLQLNADLVVLSACETGLGKLSRGEGIISLARAFAYAGAKSIVTTLWSVDDAKTKDVMVDFYRNLKKGMTKDAALRQAKLDYLKGHTNPGDAHPYYWAGFAPIGDMRALH